MTMPTRYPCPRCGHRFASNPEDPLPAHRKPDGQWCTDRKGDPMQRFPFKGALWQAEQITDSFAAIVPLMPDQHEILVAKIEAAIQAECTSEREGTLKAIEAYVGNMMRDVVDEPKPNARCAYCMELIRMQFLEEQPCPSCGEKLTKFIDRKDRSSALLERYGLWPEMMLGA